MDWKDLDEYSDEQIEAEYKRRLRWRDRGKCSYCLGPWEEHSCKFVGKPGWFPFYKGRDNEPSID